jgi:trehalose-phosphatase
MSSPYWAIGGREIEARIIPGRRILIACDFDGTLAPIVAQPEAARLPTATRLILQRLMSCAGISLAFVSGRRLSDLRERVGLEGVFYCGNHGLEIQGPGFASAHDMSHRGQLQAALAILTHATARMRGVLIEDKDLTATVHWRMASEPDRKRLASLVSEVTSSFSALQLTSGKAIWELRPRSSINKGTAILDLLARTGIAAENAIFLGDDETDESGFKVLREGVTICVGDSEHTAALYRARDVKDAASFLFWLLVKVSRLVGPHPWREQLL